MSRLESRLANSDHRAATYTSSVSEWYSWVHNLRNNPNVKILKSIAPSTSRSAPTRTRPGTAGYLIRPQCSGLRAWAEADPLAQAGQETPIRRQGETAFTGSGRAVLLLDVLE
ncbi:hypothetical protein Pth03_23600 [Planotetraspora thailandica]|uniref:Uncharacterized protein n=1 Tax=Planotetraspora thailandica TaxID=487172 RepID=A0A8J3V2V2_9ACTN|nr:hypothetical protein Pth03_23600 [Planotetraspora thailandica]